MIPQKEVKVLAFPPIQKKRRKTFDTHNCHICGFPSRTERGLRIHFHACHTHSRCADRNWEILYFHMEHGVTVRQLAHDYHLSLASVTRIIQRGLTYPGIYELED